MNQNLLKMLLFIWLVLISTTHTFASCPIVEGEHKVKFHTFDRQNEIVDWLDLPKDILVHITRFLPKSELNISFTVFNIQCSNFNKSSHDEYPDYSEFQECIRIDKDLIQLSQVCKMWYIHTQNQREINLKNTIMKYRLISFERNALLQLIRLYFYRK